MVTGKKILVTGGAGYIGAHTSAELILQGFTPIVIDNFSKSDRTLLDGLEKITGTPIAFYEGDCTDKMFVRSVLESEGYIDAIIHFAAYKSVGESVKLPLMYYQNNLDSLITMLGAMQEHDIPNIIFSSSCTVYGQPDHIPVAEGAPFKKAESPYGATKQMCEQVLQDFAIADPDVKIISLRYFNPVGAHPSSQMGELPLDVPGNLVPFITQTAAGIRKKLIIFGDDYDTPDGTCLRDFIHILDVADAHVAALNVMLKDDASRSFEAYNLGSGAAVSVLELVKMFISVTGVDLPYEIGPRRAGDVVKTYADPSLALEKLRWKTKRSMEEALRDAWNWQKKISGISW